MIGTKPYSSPCVSRSKLSSSDGDPLSNISKYRQLVGALQYCTLIHPKIAYSVNQLFQFLHSSTSSHWTSLKRVLCYLKGFVDHGLYYTQGSLSLQAFCDTDWANDPDDRRSTTGFGVFLKPCLVSWCPKKQPIVSHSSTEAKYRAMVITTTELYWIQMLLKDLVVPLFSTPTLWCDKMGAMALASNPAYHTRTKHIELDYHLIRKKILNKDISIQFISTHDKLADIFTKGLTSDKFLFLCSKLMIFHSPMYSFESEC
jgi:hypothetical protein